MAARFDSTEAGEFTLQQQNVKTKASTKYAVKVLSDFMLEGILQDLRECQNQQLEIIILKTH
jgi:hypothetical protein